jgi:hypothetical protein
VGGERGRLVARVNDDFGLMKDQVVGGAGVDQGPRPPEIRYHNKSLCYETGLYQKVVLQSKPGLITRGLFRDPTEGSCPLLVQLCMAI